jgi:hypothetical protein
MEDHIFELAIISIVLRRSLGVPGKIAASLCTADRMEALGGSR